MKIEPRTTQKVSANWSHTEENIKKFYNKKNIYPGYEVLKRKDGPNTFSDTAQYGAK